MVNPDAHRPVGFITDRDGRQLKVKTDYGDVILDAGLSGYWRLSANGSATLEVLLHSARVQARMRESRRLEREAE